MTVAIGSMEALVATAEAGLRGKPETEAGISAKPLSRKGAGGWEASWDRLACGNRPGSRQMAEERGPVVAQTGLLKDELKPRVLGMSAINHSNFVKKCH